MKNELAMKVIRLLPTRMYLELRWLRCQLSHSEIILTLNSLKNTTTSANYSLKVFDEKRAIFVHIPKCGGVSICKSIFGNLAGGHNIFDHYICLFRPAEILSYFKFTVVRNPWDRLVSAYCFLKRGGLNPEDKKWANNELRDITDFKQFVNHWLTEANITKEQHFFPQVHFIRDKYNKVDLDFVGFLENINEDIKYIGYRLKMDIKLPVLNRSMHKKYYDEDTKKRVAEIYKDDIETFGYSFDNSTIKKQIIERNKKYKVPEL